MFLWICRARLTELVAAVMTAMVCRRQLRLDPQVPVVKVGKKLGSWVIDALLSSDIIE